MMTSSSVPSLTSSSPSPAWSSWLTDHESEAITRALQMSLSNNNNNDDDNDDFSLPASADDVTRLSATSDLGRVRNPIPDPRNLGKQQQRKSRANKDRTPTKYIEVDPENFRAMVQKMTGTGSTDDVVRPEPRRIHGFMMMGRAEEDLRRMQGPMMMGRAGEDVSAAAGPVMADEPEMEFGFDVDEFLISYPTLDSTDTLI